MRSLLRGRGGAAFLRMLSSTVANQAILSGTNLLVGLILIRATADEQYGYYVLVVNSILLFTSLQGAFLHPPLSVLMATDGKAACAPLLGGLARDQNRLIAALGAVCAAGVVLAWLLGVVTLPLAGLLLAAILASGSAMYREIYRTFLFVARLPNPVLRSDLFYVTGQVIGVGLATLTHIPAIVALLTLALSAMVGGKLLARSLAQEGGIDPAGAPAEWRSISQTGGWSVAGAGAHWAFSQGYNYVVAAMLDVSSVSSLAATRLLLMPINLLSTGVNPLILPFAAEWLHKHGPSTLFRRMVLIGVGLMGLASVYLLILALTRDWIFAHIMHKHYPHADILLAIWSVNFLIAAFRDRLAAIPGIFGRFQALFVGTVATAVIALLCCWFGIRMLGLAGAPLSVLIGELLSLLFVIVLSIHLIRRAVDDRQNETKDAPIGPPVDPEISGL